MEKKNDTAVIMEIEVKFGKGKVDQVTVHHGDEPYDLAKVNHVYLLEF